MADRIVVMQGAGFADLVDRCADSPGQMVAHGVRPEHLAAANQGLTGILAVVKSTESGTHVVLRLEGREMTAVLRNRVGLGSGATITLASDAAVAHLLDKATGKRLQANRGERCLKVSTIG